jgi:bifunctional non-homologous end joining protein LigD
LSWRDVRAGLDPKRFTIRSVPELLVQSDAWSEYDAGERPLADAAKRLGAV